MSEYQHKKNNKIEIKKLIKIIILMKKKLHCKSHYNCWRRNLNKVEY
jgi:hypothetical protein